MRKLLVAVCLALLTTSSAFASPKEKKSDSSDAACMKAMEGFFNAWNQHDAKAMVAFWADDATLINPMGRMANGKSEIEKLMTEEQSTMFKGSTAKMVDMKVTRSMGSNMAFCDGEMTLNGAMGPDGAALPEMKVHLAAVMMKKGSSWVFADARPYQFVTPPPAAGTAPTN